MRNQFRTENKDWSQFVKEVFLEFIKKKKIHRKGLLCVIFYQQLRAFHFTGHCVCFYSTTKSFSFHFYDKIERRSVVLLLLLILVCHT